MMDVEPYHEIKNSQLFNMDNIEGMKTYYPRFFDLAIVDPPYGLGNRLSDGGGKLKDTPMAELYRDKSWDVLPTKEYWEQLFRISKNQIIFGANYFLDYLPSTRGFICWDKKQALTTLSECELIWTSFDKPAKIWRKSSMDMNRFHPTQKPVEIYDFVILYSKIEKLKRVIDTHAGSGTSRIACHKNNLIFTGFEIDREYCEKSVKLFTESTIQTNLF
jgi:site-specific DNA-methyltransferase (adenine-specific)